MAEDELKQVKAMVRSVLMSCKEGVVSSRFLVDYRDVTGEYLPYKNFGFRNVSDFVASMPDVIHVRYKGPDEIYHGVADETTAHIQKLVSKQRSKKTKRPLRKPMRGGKSFKPPYRPPAGRGYMPPSYQPRPPYPGAPRPPRTPGQQPHYAAIRRYGPQPTRPRFPLIPTPPRVLNWAETTPPTSPAEEPWQNFQITVRNSPANRGHGGGDARMRPKGGRMIFQAMSEAMSDCQGQENMKFGHKFEVPPRFRKRSGEESSSEPSKFVGDGASYINNLNDYLRSKGLPPANFDTTQARGGLHVSSVRVEQKVFGSIEMYSSSQDAEFAAAKNACRELLRENSSPASFKMSISESDLKEWLKKLLVSLPNGMWATRLPVLYKEEFSEEPPGKLVAIIKSWTDLTEVETICGRDLVKLKKEEPVKVEPVKWKEIEIPEAELLNPQENVTVYVTFVVKVDYFFVQTEDSCIDDINEKLKTLCPKSPAPEKGVLKKGMFCAALYHEDEEWYRGEILALKDEKSIRVMFVDYGNIETVAIENVRQLPEDVVSIPAQAIPCALFGIILPESETGVDSPPSLKEFSTLVKESSITALTVSYNTDGQCVVVLSKEDVCINLQLLRLGVVSTDVEEWAKLSQDSGGEEGDEAVEDGPGSVILPEEKMLGVYVCFISPDLGVTVRIVGDEYSDKLDEFEMRLEECYKSASSSGAVSAGQVCIASMDGLYQRVLINSLTDNNKAECFFPDHGDTETLPLAQIRPLSAEMNSSLPYQAVRCHLAGLEKVTDTVTAVESLLDLALGKTCVAEIVERDERLSVILYDTSEDAELDINQGVKDAIAAVNRNNQTNKSPPSNISPGSTKSNKSNSPRKPDSPLSLPNTSVKDARLDSNFNRTLSTTSNESWGTEEEAEALAASYEPSSKWNSSDVQSPSNVHAKKSSPHSDNVTQKFGEMSIGTWTPVAKSTPDSVVKTSPKSRGSPGSVDSDTKKGIYTWGGEQSGHVSVPQLVDTPGVGEFFDVHVLWVSDPTNFWCTPYKMVLLLDDMMKELNKYFKTNKERVALKAKDLKPGSLLAGLVDDSWYRIILKNVFDDQLSVYFADYGQYNVLPITDLQPLPERFYSLPLCAVKAKLHDIKALDVHKPWSEAAKFKFMELTQGRDLVCLVCDKNTSSGMISVKLVDTSSESDILIDEVLLDMNFARSLES